MASDERYDLLAKEYAGAMKSEGKLKRSMERRGRHILGLIDKNGRLRHEVKKMEELLVWIHKTEQPIEEIRKVIEREIPRSLARDGSSPDDLI